MLFRSVKGWGTVTPTVGGSRTAASGTPAAYVVRRDYNLRLTLRLYETELPYLGEVIRWGQLAESFLWIPDANEPATRHWVYLEGPLAGESWEPLRDATYGKVFAIDLLLRRLSGGPWDLNFYPDP